jgi:formylglycine-generating enzyme required for sulfatase activity
VRQKVEQKAKNKLHGPLWCKAFVMVFGVILMLAACFPAKKPADITVHDDNINNTTGELHTSAAPAVQLTPESAKVPVNPEPVPAVTEVISALAGSPSVEVPAVQPESTVKQPARLSAAVNLVLIPDGIFQMGSNNGDSDEAPVHSVKIKSFYMGKYEISQKEYAAVMGNNPSGFKGDNLPVENISWYDAVEYCNRLSGKEGLQPAYTGEGENITCNFAASGYRLPTEAEWEYAAKSGRHDFIYAGSDNADEAGWYNANSNGQTNITGSKKPNGFNLYDMSGNVTEWCWDIYGAYENGEQNNPTGVLSGKIRTARGGAWGNNGWKLRVTARSYYAPTARNSSLGFRVARSGE